MIYQQTKNQQITAANYTLRKKRNPQKKADPGKWYTVFKPGEPIKEKNMTRMATEGGTME